MLILLLLEQLSVAVAAGIVKVPVHELVLALMVKSAGQSIWGPVVSSTLIICEPVTVVLLPHQVSLIFQVLTKTELPSQVDAGDVSVW